MRTTSDIKFSGDNTNAATTSPSTAPDEPRSKEALHAAEDRLQHHFQDRSKPRRREEGALVAEPLISLVLEAIKDLEAERKCWRLVGGVLVERTIAEIDPALKERVDQLSVKLQAYNERLSIK